MGGFIQIYTHNSRIPSFNTVKSRSKSVSVSMFVVSMMYSAPLYVVTLCHDADFFGDVERCVRIRDEVYFS